MTLSVVRLTVDYVHISNKKDTNIALNFGQGEEADLPAERHLRRLGLANRKVSLCFIYNRYGRAQLSIKFYQQ